MFIDYPFMRKYEIIYEIRKFSLCARIFILSTFNKKQPFDINYSDQTTVLIYKETYLQVAIAGILVIVVINKIPQNSNCNNSQTCKYNFPHTIWTFSLHLTSSGIY